MDEIEARQVQYASFLVRLWQSSASMAEGSSIGWQGEVEHIQSGRRLAFASVSELCELLNQPLGAGASLPEAIH